MESDEEVQNNGVNRERCKGDRDIDESHGGGFDEWVIHRCLLMTQDQRTVSIQGRDFGHGTQGDKQNGTREDEGLGEME